MKGMYLFSLTIATSLFMSACCCDTKENSVENSVPVSTAVTAAVDKREFKGTIPCASCPGIETELDLDFVNKTFELDSKYLGKNETEVENRGTFELSADSMYVILKDNDPNQPQKVFLLADNAAYMVTKVGDNNKKLEYKLTRN